MIKFFNLPISERKVSSTYLVFKLVISVYIIIAYVYSHLQFAWKHIEYECDKNVISNSTLDTKMEKKLEEKDHLCNLPSTWPYYWLYLTMWSFNFYTISIILDTSLVVYRFLIEKKNYEKTKSIEESSSNADILDLL